MKFSGTHIKSVYFLGIGGIGMSALARYFHREGVAVSGYDRSESVVTKALTALGVQVFHTEDASRITGKDLLVYTPAIPETSEELSAARASGITLMKRAAVLGELSKQYQTLAVAGTHGKTTTSTMLAHFLRAGGIDASAFLGGISNNLNGNFAHGSSSWMVTEADEYDRSFLHLHPYTGILTSLDPDHLDIYGSSDQMEDSYRQFAAQSTSCLVHHSISTSWASAHPTYGVGKGDNRAENLRTEGIGVRFNFRSDRHQIDDLYLPMAGEHNVTNATAAITTALSCGVSPELLSDAVSSFRGIYRRFDVKYHTDQMTHIDDYAHHPSEIEAVITTARQVFFDRKVTVLFQPHLYSRTRDFAEGFMQSLSLADEVMVLPIYPARELPIEGVTAEMLVKGLTTGKSSLVTKGEISEKVASSLTGHDVILTLGAGDIDKEVESVTTAVSQFVSDNQQSLNN